MLFEIRPVLSFVAAFALCTGLGASQTLRDSRFKVTSVSLNGPSSINNGTSATYTLTVNIQRTGQAQGATLVGTSGTPRIRPSLYAGNTQLTFQEIDFGPNQNSATVNLTLSCRSNEVRGNKNGSGAGSRRGSWGGFLRLPWWDIPAKVAGRLNETKSGELSILCN
jgi:hypothetical protein